MKNLRYSYALDCTNRHGFFTFRMEELGRKGAFSFVRLEDGTELMMPTRKVFVERHDAHLAGRRSVARISASAGTRNLTHRVINGFGVEQNVPQQAQRQRKERSTPLIQRDAVMHSLRP